MKREETANNINESKRKRTPIAFYFVMLVFYFICTILLGRVAQSEGVVTFAGKVFPIASFTGVLSTLVNFVTIFMVVFYNKLGFVTVMVIVGTQLPMLVRRIMIQEVVTSFAGLFTNVFILVASIIIYRRNRMIDKYQATEVEHLKEQQLLSKRLFEQTATALVNSIDAKDTYSRGHSVRVAEYSEKIARVAGKSDEECEMIFYSALLHDVGKIGISDAIINKNGKLTNDEYDIIKEHPVMGNQILSSIEEYPYLSVGAHYHHERYDGKGYPDGLKGEEIPEIARIISVADAYDAMTSNRSYRSAIPQQIVREEIVKGAGTQFDPEFAIIMQHLIDVDTDYQMRERVGSTEFDDKKELHCTDYRSDISNGIYVNEYTTYMHMKYTPNDSSSGVPMIILFDSLDGQYHDDAKSIKELLYFEYCELFMDGKFNNKNVREISVKTHKSANAGKKTKSKEFKEYDIEASRYKDHALIKIDDGSEVVEFTIALPDNTRWAYIGVTGEHCVIADGTVKKTSTPIASDYITRIADEISFIDGPDGDIPNIQIDGHRTDNTKGIKLEDNLKITFHSKSLPTARLLWHCPYVTIFYSDDQKVFGKGYNEYALIRLDGESWDEQSDVDNKIVVTKNDDFPGWDEWKEANKQGCDYEITFERKGDIIVTYTEILGLSVVNTTVIRDGADKVYVALTGDQCALTNIKIGR